MKDLDKIDFVITWVDGSDPKWLKSRARYGSHEESDPANGAMRYRDWGLLKYWLRTVEKNCPWVNKVYLITCGQCPEWLNTDNPKLQLVKHSDYIPADCLPTFNSNSIELLIPTIESLSNQFVLFNDDTFVLKPTSPDYFFRNGVPRDDFGYDAICASGDGKVIFANVQLNDCQLIMRHTTKNQLNHVLRRHFSPIDGLKSNLKTLFLSKWKYLTGIHNPHQPVSYRKDLCNKLIELERVPIMKSCHNRFRDRTDLSHWIYRYWQLANDCYVNRPSRDQAMIELKSDNSDTLKAIKHGKYRMACLNDSDETIDFNKAKQQLLKFFESEYPEKSRFER